MTPREMFIEGMLADQHPGNVWKRVHRCERLADAIGATVGYGFNTTTSTVDHDGKTYAARSLRQLEAVLRHLKKRVANSR